MSMRELRRQGDRQKAADLWRAVADNSSAQVQAIAAGDADGLDVLFARRAELLALLADRDVARDVADDPSLRPLIAAAEAGEKAAGTALLAAQAQLAKDLAQLRVRREARKAFLNGSESPVLDRNQPRFLDCQR